MFFQVARTLYIFGKNDTEMMLYSPPKKNIKQKFHETLSLLCKIHADIFYYCLKCWFHNLIASQPSNGSENIALGQLMSEPFSSHWFFLEPLPFPCLHGTALTGFSFFLTDQLFPVSFGLFVPPPSPCPRWWRCVYNTVNVLPEHMSLDLFPL